MKKTQKISKILLIAIFLIGFVQCKTQDVAQKLPFEITKKTYFYFSVFPPSIKPSITSAAAEIISVNWFSFKL